MAGNSWKDSISQATLDSLHQVYLALFRAHIPLRNKQRAFEAAVDGEHSWPIVGITTEALTTLCINGSCDGLRRAHRVLRVARGRAMFDVSTPLPQAKLFDDFFAQDEVVLATRGENGRHGDAHWSKVITVPHGIFSKPGMKAVATPEDLRWADAELARMGLQVPPRLAKRASRRGRRTATKPT